MVYCTIAAIKWKNEGEWGWVGSGWVASGERRSLLDSTQASLFFRSAVTIVPFTVHFVLQHERLEQAMLSLNKLSKKNDNNNKAVMQNTSHYYRYLLRVSCGATYYEKGIES